MSQDIFVEVGHGPTLIDNNILLSDASLRMATQGVAMVHNLICGALTCVGGGTGPRYTPYHIPHRTEVMGFMTILHGDDRFYNNIFVQKWPSKPFTTLRDSSEGTDEENREVGTHVMDEYPTYEEWIQMFDMDTDTPDMVKLDSAHSTRFRSGKGQCYFNGAKACKKETEHLVDTEHEVTVDVICQDGRPVLSTNLYEFLGDFSTGMVNSDILGCAFEPEERYENRTERISSLTEIISADTADCGYFPDRLQLRKTPDGNSGKTDETNQGQVVCVDGGLLQKRGNSKRFKAPPGGHRSDSIGIVDQFPSQRSSDSGLVTLRLSRPPALRNVKSFSHFADARRPRIPPAPGGFRPFRHPP